VVGRKALLNLASASGCQKGDSRHFVSAATNSISIKSKWSL